MKHADRIRGFGRERYVLPARQRKEKRFSIRVSGRVQGVGFRYATLQVAKEFEVAGYVMKGLATDDLVIWSPPVLRYAFAMVRHLPKAIWRKVADR